MDTKTNEKMGLSVISLILGIATVILGTVSGIFSIALSMFFPILAPITCCCVPFLLGAAGIALGIIGIRKEHQKIAIFGLIISIIGIIIILGFMVICLITPIVASLGAIIITILPFLAVNETISTMGPYVMDGFNDIYGTASLASFSLF